jgi:hypothetical protein
MMGGCEEIYPEFKMLRKLLLCSSSYSYNHCEVFNGWWGRHGPYCMVVGLTTTCAISTFTVIVTVGLVWFMVINATFTLVEKTGVSGENHRPVASQ